MNLVHQHHPYTLLFFFRACQLSFSFLSVCEMWQRNIQELFGFTRHANVTFRPHLQLKRQTKQFSFSNWHSDVST
jgi:hypothetical protein